MAWSVIDTVIDDKTCPWFGVYEMAVKNIAVNDETLSQFLRRSYLGIHNNIILDNIILDSHILNSHILDSHFLDIMKSLHYEILTAIL